MVVFVINKHGNPLMPCKPRKARVLLKEKKAKIVSHNPFTIQLLYGSSGYTQEVNIGVDLGAKHVGIAITSDDKVLAKGEVELRQDVKAAIDTRRTYRRSRRNRKTRYRKPRFQNRNREKGWLPPSIQSRVENTFFWIDKFYDLVPNTKLTIEVGKFDVQKMIDPDIAGVTYQQGQTYGYHDVRYFVFARDNYTCHVCKQKGKILNTHHLIYRSHGGSNRADNLVTVCTDCHTHENHQNGSILWKWMIEGKRLPQYKEGPFMNSFRRRVFFKYPHAAITYGSVTTPKRKELGLEKSHMNDAIAISGIPFIKENTGDIFNIKQFRKKKRSLHEATARKGRKTKNTTSKRNEKNKKYLNGFYLNDKVRVYETTGYITGFTGTSGAYVKSIEGDYITMPNKSYKQVGLKDLKRISHNNNWQFDQKAFG
ncbi:5-methylcytosine-specific restriction endonuclease McrA [Virgibacillus natechei]|uniref:5-methylcytosine-specific restriction endonuclease McrA n=1 Tax=Virgibacillus natechei TaxID=1216297 RepID=A0ABS4IF56_9BACI|nr:RNA-guided endonuclease IscB [Virgibacillus natechei]MBP1968961.1 5-methylcytosine-specific restriction endonuclease McrA [Virgibacillus natechei]UZD14241.1 RNA-guided endonuclease IscB [Virgibacillus natechei]